MSKSQKLLDEFTDWCSKNPEGVGSYGASERQRQIIMNHETLEDVEELIINLPHHLHISDWKKKDLENYFLQKLKNLKL